MHIYIIEIRLFMVTWLDQKIHRRELQLAPGSTYTEMKSRIRKTNEKYIQNVNKLIEQMCVGDYYTKPQMFDYNSVNSMHKCNHSSRPAMLNSKL